MFEPKPIYEPREAEWRQSKREAPFCPTCKTELDELDLINVHDECKCGSWAYNYDHVLQFKPKDKK
jgi:hypothetical protein